MLTEEQLGQFIDEHFTHDLFRLETLDHYDVGTDDEDFHRYLAGEREPNAEGKLAWLDVIRQEKAAGKHSRRVHVVRGPVSDYLRYECEWGYVYNVEAGEDIRILDLTERPLRTSSFTDMDFFVVDDEWAVLMHYDAGGRYQGSSVVSGDEIAGYLELRDALWETAVPFTDWWSAHPEYWRQNRAA